MAEPSRRSATTYVHLKTTKDERATMLALYDLAAQCLGGEAKLQHAARVGNGIGATFLREWEEGAA
jgi:hypothetical protein